MKNYALALTLIAGIGIGLLFGKLVWKETPRQAGSSNMLHQMPDGSMMGNEPMDMNDMMHGMTSDLVGKSGDEFDRTFLEGMIVHHQGAVDMAKMVLEKSKRPELLNLANEIISAQDREILMMKVWEKEWFGN